MKEQWEAFLKFLLTFNEWTGKNRRYITINVHTTNADFTNLGMVRAWSSQKAETILELVTKISKDFGLAMDNIVAFVTYGAFIMMKLRRLAPCEFYTLFGI